MTFNFKVLISLKDGIVDPQGQAVKKVLRRSGFYIENVRFGKIVSITIDAKDKDEARGIAVSVAKDVLSNPVLENYEIVMEN